MAAVTLEHAQSKLSELVHHLSPGEELLITENDRLVARLVSPSDNPVRIRKLGTLAGTVKYIAPDFNAQLDEFKDYTE